MDNVRCKRRVKMKKLTFILLIIATATFFLGSVSHLWAGNPKKANFHFDVKFDDKGKVTGVDRWNEKREPEPGMEPARVETGEITGVKTVGTILILKGDDPCVSVGGNTYCWP